MPAPDIIIVSPSGRLVGTADAPRAIDVRTEGDVSADPRTRPASVHRDVRTVADWAGKFGAGPVVVACQLGLKLGVPRTLGVTAAAGLALRLSADA
jgi:hypothetical protein